eukprot:g6619.t1 g6619   contig23:888225-889310(-)
MLGTKASKAERQQLILNREAVRESDVDEEGGSGDIMSSSRLMLFPISLGLAAVFLLLAFTGIVVVSPGELAVVVTLGHVDVYQPGPHFRTPFISTVHIMTTKTQLISEKNRIPTQEGLAVSLDVALLYRIDPKMAGQLFQNVGVDYAKVLIEPEAASVIRGLTSESDAKALYSSGRHQIQDAVREELDKTLGAQGIIIESVMLKDLELPESLSKAIELKAQAEQESARMEFVLAKERQEAERKAIEAKGIADFQKIVSEGISEQTLMWKGIEATEKLVESQNAKIIIIGNRKGDLPVIFNGD